MPWSETTPMDQKTQFIADYLREHLSLTELWELYGISRKTGYKFIDRYLKFGPHGLEERSRIEDQLVDVRRTRCSPVDDSRKERATPNCYTPDRGLDDVLEHCLESWTERHGDENLVRRLVPHEGLEISSWVQMTSRLFGLT